MMIKKMRLHFIAVYAVFLFVISPAFGQNFALGPGLSIITQLNDTMNLGPLWGVNFAGKYFSSDLPIAFGGNLSFNGKSFNEVNRFQVFQAGAEVDVFLSKKKVRPYFGIEIGVLGNYRDDTSIPTTNFYLDMNPKIGSIIPLSDNTWLDVFVGYGYGTNDFGDFIYLPFGLGLIYDTLK
jgi:hypothetical protein